jgi:hypothetical protein
MARYTPGNVPSDSASIGDFLRVELQKIAQAMETSNERLTLDTLYAAPKKYREGTVVLADGVTWNPGAGAGVYVYRGAAWHLLG